MVGTGKVWWVFDGSDNSFILASVLGRATIDYLRLDIFLLNWDMSRPMLGRVQVLSSDTKRECGTTFGILPFNIRPVSLPRLPP